jgi:SSS family solute:Na+ symporter
MWSITLTDMVQFVIKTIGVFFLLLPFTWFAAGGYDGIMAKLGPAGSAHFDITSIGADTIVTYFVIYSFGMLIGQDIWQRVFTARSPGIAKWGGTVAGVYCVAYGVAGALIGTAAAAVITDIPPEHKNDVYAAVTEKLLPTGLSGVVLAAAVAAMMSTASGALIACATVARADVVPLIGRLFGKADAGAGDGNPEHDMRSNRLYVVVLGVVATVIAAVVGDVVTALTIAYDILVSGLFVPILGGFLWKRATGTGALAAMGVGTVVTLVTMAFTDILANDPVYWGLGLSLVAYVGVSLMTPATPTAVLDVWFGRLSGRDVADSDDPQSAVRSHKAG